MDSILLPAAPSARGPGVGEASFTCREGATLIISRVRDLPAPERLGLGDLQLPHEEAEDVGALVDERVLLLRRADGMEA
jgi:hypothetical protein